MQAVPVGNGIEPSRAGPPRIESSNAWVERQEARNLLPQTQKNASTMNTFKLGLKENSSPSKAKKMESRKYATEHPSPEKQ